MACPDSAPGKPENITALTLFNQGRLTTAGASITTIIWSLTSDIFSINSFPPCHRSKSGLSPIEFSTIILLSSSPESAFTKIITTSASFEF